MIAKNIVAVCLTLWLGVGWAAASTPQATASGAPSASEPATQAQRVEQLQPRTGSSGEACAPGGGCHVRNVGLAIGLSILAMTLATDAIQKLKL